eukprot:11187720-Lingulodinium_polyedra.AAC.1
MPNATLDTRAPNNVQRVTEIRGSPTRSSRERARVSIGLGCMGARVRENNRGICRGTQCFDNCLGPI